MGHSSFCLPQLEREQTAIQSNIYIHICLYSCICLFDNSKYYGKNILNVKQAKSGNNNNINENSTKGRLVAFQLRPDVRAKTTWITGKKQSKAT